MKTSVTFGAALLSLSLLATARAQPPTAGLGLWLKADTLAGLNSGDKVTTWADASGNGNDAANPTDASQPVYIADGLNGLPVVRFADGGNLTDAGQYLDSALTLNANGASCSVFVLVRSGVEATGRDTIIQPLNDNTTNKGRTVLYLENGAGLAYKAQSYLSGTSLESVRGYVPGEWTLYGLVQDSAAGTVKLWRDGKPDGVAPMGADKQPNGQWRLGDNKDHDAGLQGDLAEVLVYASALSAEDRAAVEDYLFGKYGLARGGSGYDLLLRDNFNVTDNTNDINYQNTAGRQSASGGPVVYLENGAPDALSQLNNPDSPGMLRLQATPTSSFVAVTPDRNFTDGGNFKLEFDLDAGINDIDSTSGDWACVVLGSSTRGPSFVNSSDGLGILFRNSGAIQVFDGATDTGGGAQLPTGLLHVRIEVSTADFQGGSPATFRAWVNDQEVRLSGGSFEYVKPSGLRGNYITLAGAAWGGEWVHGFDNLLVAAQPCIRSSAALVHSYPGQTNQTVTVQIPPWLNLSEPVTVDIQSSDPTVAEPLGAAGLTLSLEFPPGVTAKSFNVAAWSHGNAVFAMMGPEGACALGNIAVGVGASLVANPSFEENYASAWPHYGPINGWSQIPGGNIGVNEADGPFHDNSAIPDRERVALYQGNGGIAQLISGLAPGGQYWLQFRYNKRNGGAMALSVFFDGLQLDSIPAISVAGPGAYHFRNVPFTPTSDSGLLEFRAAATGDATLLLDAVTIVPRGTNQILVQNPSFEASGDVPSPGVVEHSISGWTGTGTVGINRIGQDNADGGWNPDQDHVAFIQGLGSLSQIVSNLTIGTPYQIRVGCSAKSTDFPTLRVSMGETVLYENYVVPAYQGEPYTQLALDWQALARTAELKFEQTDEWGGTVLLDDVQIIGVVLPPTETKLSATRAEFFAGQPLGPTNIVITMPFYLVATQTIEVLVVSLNPNVAVPAGATDGSLRLVFTAGGLNTRSFDILPLGSGTAAFLITNNVDCPEAWFTVRNRRSFVLNPSFEDTSAMDWPGYHEIVEWTGGSGLNPIAVDNPQGRSPFADNGAIPDGAQVAFLQGPAALGQTLYGLNTNQHYWLQLYVNARNCCGDAPIATARFNGVDLIPPTTVPVAGAANPYFFVNIPFTPDTPQGVLLLSSEATPLNGDRTMLVDAASLVARPSGQVVLQNPSFEASGVPPWPGAVQSAMAGWVGAGSFGVNISGNGPFADNGSAPDQDNVAFLQGEGASLSQTVTGLTTGSDYQLSFACNARAENSPQLTVTVDGAVFFDQAVSPVGGARPYEAGSFTFTAGAEAALLTFAQTAVGDHTILLDNIALAPLAPPELRLAIRLAPLNTVRLSWPVTAGGNCVLETAATLAGPWQDSGLPVATEDQDYAAYDGLAAGTKFYRLSRP